MVRIIESTKYYIATQDGVVIDDREVNSKEEILRSKSFNTSKKTFKDLYDDDLYILTLDEYHNKFNRYPYDYYVYKNGEFVTILNARDKSEAERLAKACLDEDEYDEILLDTESNKKDVLPGWDDL